MTIQHPEIRPGFREGETVATHPAYGQISASRVSIGGRGQNLYGSDFAHHAAVSITIATSELHRGLSSDRYHPRDEIIRLSMSESQWATFVSSLNHGSGPCCTLEYVMREEMPEIPNPVDRTKQFGDEMEKTLKDAFHQIEQAKTALKASGLSAKKADEIMAKLNKAQQEITSNVKFVAKQFNETMEETVEKAKQEIHGYIDGAVSRAGISSLKSSDPVLSLDFEE